MNVEELFRGVGIVVDDKVLGVGTEDKIVPIVSALEKNGIPLVKYEHIPNINALNLLSVSFILLDWEFVSIMDEEGAPIPTLGISPQEESKKLLIKFIRDVIETCYLPIFIFSNTGEDDIKRALNDHDIDIEKDCLPIFVKTKTDLMDGNNVKVFEEIGKWLDDMPAIYLLKVWGNAIEDARTNAFKALASTKCWPSIIWNTATTDSVDAKEELMHVLTQNIMSRMSPLPIEHAQLEKSTCNQYTQDEILDVLRIQRYDSNNFQNNTSRTGDLYKIHGNYYINIRPSCDCINRDGQTHDVYLIKGDVISRVNQDFNEKYGNFPEKINEAIVGPLVDNKFYSFKFKNLKIKSYEEIKEKKLGRVLPPFITHITERFGLYIQRQGLPRIPKEAICGLTNPKSIDSKEQESEINEEKRACGNAF